MTLAVVATGGVVGAWGRQALSDALAEDGGWPTATFVANVAGCLLIGALVAAVVDPRRPRPALTAFLGAGVLGGFTTFSAVSIEVRALLVDRPALALGYVASTALASVVAAWTGFVLVRRLRHLRRGDEPGWQA